MITTYTESGPNIGMGHVKRVERLKGALENAGLGNERIAILDAPCFNARIAGCATVWKRTEEAERLVQQHRESGNLVIVLTEDYAAPVPPDIVVDSRFDARRIGPWSGTWDGITRKLEGCKYAILGEEYRPEYITEKRRIPKRGPLHLLVVMGGGDTTEITKRVLEALPGYQAWLWLTVVVGPSSSREAIDKCIKQWANSEPHRLRLLGCNYSVLQGVSTLAPHLKLADIAITGGGQMLFEVARMGVPAIIVRTNDDQAANSEYLARRELAIDLGMVREFYPDKLRGALKQLTYRTRLRMHRGLRKLVDGRGTERIVREVKQALRKRRR